MILDALFVNTGVSASLGANTRPDAGSAAAAVSGPRRLTDQARTISQNVRIAFTSVC